jgi:multiple sugar transport system permease protein
MLLLAILFVLPLVWLCLTALKDLSEITAFPVQIFPHQVEWSNFAKALTMIPYGRFAFNSFLLAAIYAVLTTFSSALVGFGFARLRAKGKQVLFLLMLSMIMLPPLLTTIPTFILFARVHLVNTLWPWVLWGLASTPIYSFLFRQFFSSIPLDLEDAAIIDGCSYWRIFWEIFLPLSMPVIATVIILSFTFVWGDYLSPSLLLSANNTTLSVAMSTGYVDPHGDVLTNILAAGVIIYILPVLIVFVVAQRYFVQGIVTSGVKG